MGLLHWMPNKICQEKLGFSHKTWASSSDKSLTTKTMNYNTMGIKKKLGGYSIVEDFPFALLIPILNSEIRFP